MKIKLVESVQPFIRVLRNFETNIIPTLKNLGFEVNQSRTREINKFTYLYQGTFTSYDEKSKLPFQLKVSTAHSHHDGDEDLFAVLSIGANTRQLGWFHSNNGEELADLIDIEFDHRHKLQYTTSPEQDNGLTTTNGTSKTRKQWLQLALTNVVNYHKGTFNSFWTWIQDDKEFPDKLYTEINDLQMQYDKEHQSERLNVDTRFLKVIQELLSKER